MNWQTTSGIMAAALAMVLLARWRLAKPSEPGRVRLIPWTAVLFAAMLLGLMMFAHLLTLWGVKHD
jgi:hypothetical protein